MGDMIKKTEIPLAIVLNIMADCSYVFDRSLSMRKKIIELTPILGKKITLKSR